MGVDIAVFDFLLKFKGAMHGRALQLGRQEFHIPREKSHPKNLTARSILHNYDKHADFDQISGDNGFTDVLFSYLGCKLLKVLDASDFEGADIIRDLNVPVERGMHGMFDLIFDGGTIEHVYNVPTAFDNVRRMLAVGGLFLSVNAANNQLGHGFYQFSPELMWRAFSHEAGFEIEVMQLVNAEGIPAPIDAIDPERRGSRVEIGGTSGPVYLMVAALKKEDREVGSPIQSDYASSWEKSRAQE